MDNVKEESPALQEDEKILQEETVDAEQWFDCIDEAYDDLDELAKDQVKGDKVAEAEVRDRILHQLGHCK